METSIKIKNDTASKLSEILKAKRPPLEFVDVDKEVYNKRLKPGMRKIVVWIIPLVFLVIFWLYTGFLLCKLLN